MKSTLCQLIQYKNRYVGKPTGTRLTIEDIATTVFPSLTICPDKGARSPINDTLLKQCHAEFRYFRPWHLIICIIGHQL